MNKQQYIKSTQKYIEALPSAKKSARSIKLYATALRLFGAMLGAEEEITPLSVVQWRIALANADSKPNTIRIYLQTLRVFFAWAVRMGIVKENPVLCEELPATGAIDYDLLSADEIRALLSHTQKASGMHGKNKYRDRAIIVLLLTSGLRNSELRHLCVENLDFDGGTVTVYHGKGDKNRKAPFPNISRVAVIDYLRSGERKAKTENGLLFGTTADENGKAVAGGKWHELSEGGLLRIVREYTKAAIGHSVKTHALRHAYTSLCDDLGLPIGEVSKTLGHSSILLTEKTYLHILNRSKAAQNATEILNSFLQGESNE